MSQALPPRPNLDWYRKTAKEKLAKLREKMPGAQLADAQFALAREHGFSSWRVFKSHVEGLPLPTVQKADGRVWIEGVPPLRNGATHSGQTSYCGALSSAMQPLADGFDYPRLLGDSALAFRVRWHRRGLEKPGDWWAFTMSAGGGPEDRKLLEPSIGYTLQSHGYFWPDRPDMGQYREQIVTSIDAGRPVIAADSRDAEMGVIYGYEDAGRRVMMQDYHTYPSGHTIDTTALGGIIVFLHDSIATHPRTQLTKDALQQAIAHWTIGAVPAHNAGATWENPRVNIFYGDRAYDEWIDDLGRAEETPERRRKQLWNASWWNYDVLNDNRYTAARWLGTVAPLFDLDVQKHLLNAKSCYERFEQGDFIEKPYKQNAAFLGYWSGKKFEDWTAEHRREEIAILHAAQALDREAILHLQRALTSMT